MPNDPGDVRNFGAVFDETARVEPTRIAIIDTSGRTLSYGDFAVRVAHTANALDSMGVSERDRVALLYPNGVDYLVATLAVARVGAVPVPVTPKLSAEKLRFVLDDCGARLMLVADRQTVSGSVASAITQADSVTTVALHTRTTALYLDNTNVVLLRDRIDDMVSHRPAVVSASDPAMQPYTSGSTGRPKGVVLSHGGIEWCTTAFVDHLSLDETDRGLVVTPLAHKNAMTGVVKPMLACGGSIVLLEQFDSQAAIEALVNHDVSYMTGVPAIYKRLVGEADILDSAAVSSLSWASCGSAAVPESLVTEFERTFEASLLEVYGLTEGGPVVTHSPRNGPRKIGSSGVPLSGVVTRLVDPITEELLPTGESGELLVSSPGLGRYHGRPDANEESFVSVDGTRFLRTGDLVRIDADGYHYVLGRLDDMMIVGGENLYPADVENRLLKHDAVADVAVVSVPHGEKGEAPVAFVVRDAPVSSEELQTFVLDNGPAYAYPRRVYFESHLVLAGSGKVNREKLRERAVTALNGPL